MSVTPYLFLDGRCEEAIEFYKKAIGAEVGMMMRFKEAPPEAKCSAATENKIMHACVTINGAPVMMSDGRVQNQPKFEGFSLSLDSEDPAKAKRWFDALAQGGQVTQPLTETFFAKSFGMLHDKFGIGWMVIAGGKNP